MFVDDTPVFDRLVAEYAVSHGVNDGPVESEILILRAKVTELEDYIEVLFDRADVMRNQL